MQTFSPTIRRHCMPELILGEGPFWHQAEQALYFVDIRAPALHRLDPTTDALTSWPMPAPIGSFGLTTDGRAIVALRTGVHLFDFTTETLELLVHPEPEMAENRLNDGKVGPDGRFWVGSMHDRPERQPTGSLYRIDHDGTCTRMVEGLKVSNGLAWSPDGRTMYHSDSTPGWIQAFDYDLDTGDLANQRFVRTLTTEEGRPDGAAMDAEGCYWSAGVTAGVLNRIAPDGTILLRVALPLAAPTMPCFGGADMKTLFVTSLASDRLGAMQAGTLISFRVDIPGIAVGLFGATAGR